MEERKPVSSDPAHKEPTNDAQTGCVALAKTVPIPDHELLRCIGRGSYGTVWLARNKLGAYRAVKLVHRESFSSQRPFEREWSGICKFEPVSRSHEGFVDILHVGINEEQGYFYYVMELGDDCEAGQNVDPEHYVPKTLAKEISKRGALGIKQCLQLGLVLSDALSELHRCGLVHRDIKPSNIIFVNGVPKLADIGLVAPVGDARSYVGTEGFIPPEGPGSPQADLYSLGKVLYEACTARDRQDFPELPTNIDGLGDRDQFLELNEVILHACHNLLPKRYLTASDMHADLLVVANGKSVKRLKALERRLAHLKRAAIVAALAFAVVVIFAIPTYQEWRLQLETRQRQVGANISYGIRAIEAADFLAALPHLTEALRLDQDSPERTLMHRLRLGATLATAPKLTGLWSVKSEADFAEFSPDGNWLLVSQVSGPLKAFELKTNRSSELLFDVAGSFNADYSPDGHSIVVVNQDAYASVCDATTGKQLFRLKHPGRVFSAKFSSDGLYVLTSCEDGLARLWSVQSRQVERSFGPHASAILFCTFSHNGKFVATASADNTGCVWDLANGRRLGPSLPHESWVNYAAFSPDDRLLVTASWDRTARVWELPGCRRILPDLVHSDGIKSAEFSPDGQLIVTASADGTVRLWNTGTLQPYKADSVLQRGERAMYACFAPDGHRVVTTCTDGTVRLWDLAGSVLPPPPVRISLSADGSTYFSESNGTIRVQDAVSARPLPELTGGVASVSQLRLNRTGKFLSGVVQSNPASLEASGRILLWDVTTGQEVSTGVVFSNTVSGMTVSDDGRRIAIFGKAFVQIWDVTREASLSPALAYQVSSATFNRDGTQLAMKSGKLVRVWDCVHDQEAFPPLDHPVPVTDIEFSSDGSLLATSCSDQTLNRYFARVWDAKTGRPVSPKLMHGDGVLHVCFSPDGRRVATASEDFTAIVWDARSGKQLTPALRHDHQVKTTDFSPNGMWVVTASADMTTRVWDADTGDPLAPPLRFLEGLRAAKFLPDGRTIAVSDAENAVRLWALPIDSRPVADISAIVRLLSGVSENSSGGSPKQESPEQLWRKLASKYPSDFSVSGAQVAAWHEFQASQYELRHKWLAAVFHLNRLRMLKPNDETLEHRFAHAQEQLRAGD